MGRILKSLYDIFLISPCICNIGIQIEQTFYEKTYLKTANTYICAIHTQGLHLFKKDINPNASGSDFNDFYRKTIKNLLYSKNCIYLCRITLVNNSPFAVHNLNYGLVCNCINCLGGFIFNNHNRLSVFRRNGFRRQHRRR